MRRNFGALPGCIPEINHSAPRCHSATFRARAGIDPTNIGTLARSRISSFTVTLTMATYIFGSFRRGQCFFSKIMVYSIVQLNSLVLKVPDSLKGDESMASCQRKATESFDRNLY